MYQLNLIFVLWNIIILFLNVDTYNGVVVVKWSCWFVRTFTTTSLSPLGVEWSIGLGRHTIFYLLPYVIRFVSCLLQVGGFFRQ